MPLEWTEELETGVAEIDNQHKELFRRINMLRDAAKEGKGRDAIDEIFDFLGQYVIEHFSSEEKLMQQYEYPEADVHIRQHRYFIESYQKLKKDLHDSGQRLLIFIETNAFLGKWWMDHISKVDKALGRFLKEKMR